MYNVGSYKFLTRTLLTSSYIQEKHYLREENSKISQELSYITRLLGNWRS